MTPPTPRSTAPHRAVVAVVLSCRDRIALFRRSRLVGHDADLWHCVTGYLEAGDQGDATGRAQLEVDEETGLAPGQLSSFVAGPVLCFETSVAIWMVHVFRAEVPRPLRLTLNWEHTGYTWVDPREVGDLSDRVVWLDDVLRAAGFNPGRAADCLS